MPYVPICSCRCAFSCPGGSSLHLLMTPTHFQSGLLSLLDLDLGGCNIFLLTVANIKRMSSNPGCFGRRSYLDML